MNIWECKVLKPILIKLFPNRYWTQEDLDKALSRAEELYETLEWE